MEIRKFPNSKNLQMNKRGISAVVATILIVLISVVAVVIIWQVLRPALKGTAEKVSFSCVNVDLSINEASCVSGSEKLKVTLNSGEIVKLKVLFYNDTGSIGDAQETSSVPGELGSKIYLAGDLDFHTAENPTGVNVAGVIESETGEEQTCGLALAAPKAC